MIGLKLGGVIFWVFMRDNVEKLGILRKINKKLLGLC